MRIMVIASSDGKIIGTMRRDGESGTSSTLISPQEGQEIKEIDLPDDVANIQSAEDLHRALEQHLER
jgi:hypothetical protein